MINRLFDDAFANFGLHLEPISRIDPQDRTYRASVRMDEEGDNFVVRFEVPGVKKENINLELNESVIVLKAERSENRNDEEIRISLNRSVRIPEETEVSKVKANLKDGVLTVLIPKPPKRQPKLIAIN
tara:strand:+ start:21186 stop:21569 length:384 start_codon:yes stop_codon:yes gene_type:complete